MFYPVNLIFASQQFSIKKSPLFCIDIGCIVMNLFKIICGLIYDDIYDVSYKLIFHNKNILTTCLDSYFAIEIYIFFSTSDFRSISNSTLKYPTDTFVYSLRTSSFKGRYCTANTVNAQTMGIPSKTNNTSCACAVKLLI